MMVEEHHEADEIFVYMGGDQVVPQNVRFVRISESVTIIPKKAFISRANLINVEFHYGIEIIEDAAFFGCVALRSIKLLGVKIVGKDAFSNCLDVTNAEFGDNLETVGNYAFEDCHCLRTITIPQVRSIGIAAFMSCRGLSDIEFGEELETLQDSAFQNCLCLRRIAMPLEVNMTGNYVFYCCSKLLRVDLVGGIHKTVASLHLEDWRNEMKDEINLINQALPTTIVGGKTLAVQQWMELVTRRLNHYKAEHKALLKEAATLLELALWKAKIDEKEGGVLQKGGLRTAMGQRKRERKEICITSGASIVIKNVLPFLQIV